MDGMQEMMGKVDRLTNELSADRQRVVNVTVKVRRLCVRNRQASIMKWAQKARIVFLDHLRELSNGDRDSLIEGLQL